MPELPTKKRRPACPTHAKLTTQNSKLSLQGSAGRNWPLQVTQVLLTVAAAEKKPIGLVEVAVLSAAEMSRLHRDWYGDPALTDVISFDLSTGREIAGQIFVCREVARREARTRAHGPQEELLLYVLHGMLHLCGYDDTTPAAFRRMHAREDELLRRMGLKVRFAPGSCLSMTVKPPSNLRLTLTLPSS